MLQDLSGQMGIMRAVIEKALAPSQITNNFQTQGSSRFDRKPVLNYDNVPDQGQSPQISLRDAIETVPIFNGHNIPVEQFARACNRAKALVPPQAEPQLARLL